MRKAGIPDRLHILKGYGIVRTAVEIARIAEHKIRDHPHLEIFVHVKALCKTPCDLKQRRRQRKGDHHQRSLARCTAQICHRHAQRSAAPFTAAGGTPDGNGSLRIVHRLHRGNLCGHPCRSVAGKEHGQQGKRGRTHENPRIGAGFDAVVGQKSGGGRGQYAPQKMAACKTQWNARRAQGQRLPTHNASQLPGRGTDGFQKPVKPDVRANRNLKNIINDEIPGQQGDRQQKGQRRGGQRVCSALQRAGKIRPVDAHADVIVRIAVGALITVPVQDGLCVRLDVCGVSQIEVQKPCPGAVELRRGGSVPIQCLLHITAGEQHHAGHPGGVTLPPAGQGKGIGEGGFLSGSRAERHGERHLRANFRLDAQKR